MTNERVLAHQLRNAIAWLETTVVPTQAQWDMHERTLRRTVQLLERRADETDKLSAALTVSRGQWIHSVNARQCLEALGVPPDEPAERQKWPTTDPATAYDPKPSCPLCGRTDNHTHTAGPFGMT